MAAVLYDLVAYQKDRSKVEKMELRDPFAVGASTLEAIQEGADFATDYLQTDGIRIVGLHGGYDLEPEFLADWDDAYEAGDEGIGDFMRGFNLIQERIGDYDTAALKGLKAYGIYMATRTLLPNTARRNETSRKLLDNLTERHQVPYRDITHFEATIAVAAQAAAQLTLTVLAIDASPDFKQQLELAARGGTLVKHDQKIADSFRRPLAGGAVRQLAGRGPKPRLELV